eukprot:CAMPEP_0184486484 /NCGR_PEP_ID=MMETSP0113_2-20130426/7971_1 /TAXON_ID=91329 /ORGANISM="Norrisiella sphaerica, Strain BC52" /LENGTH=54 /DNA_ID=CAMNT_0026868381 /DNA_START=552 /DNA_END=712 /DNA_ORIENTATION=-
MKRLENLEELVAALGSSKEAYSLDIALAVDCMGSKGGGPPLSSVYDPRPARCLT